MAINVKLKDKNSIIHINMTPTGSPPVHKPPTFDTINHRFATYDLFGEKYSGDQLSQNYTGVHSTQETNYAAQSPTFSTNIDLTVSDIEDNSYFNLEDDLFGPEVPAFTVTQLIHAQDRFYDLSKRSVEVRSAPAQDSFRVLGSEKVVLPEGSGVKILPAVPTAKRKRELSFTIVTETPPSSRPSTPQSLPSEVKIERVSPFRGRGFREETSRHSTPKSPRSKNTSPNRRRTSSLSGLDKMAQVAMPPTILISRPHSPRNFVKENIDEIRGISQFNKEKNEAEAEIKRREEEEEILREMGVQDGVKNIRSRSNSPTPAVHFDSLPEVKSKPVKKSVHVSRGLVKTESISNDNLPNHSKIPKKHVSISPNRMTNGKVESKLKNQRFISNSTSNVYEPTIKIGSTITEKRAKSRSTQNLNVPTSVKSKPPISPVKMGPPPTNSLINPKRLSPIAGTPNKSPTDSARSPKTSPNKAMVPKKSVNGKPVLTKTTPKPPVKKPASRDPSPDKKKPISKTPVSKTQSKVVSKPPISTTQTGKTEPSKSITRTNSVKNLTKTPSVKNLTEKQHTLQKKDSKKDLKKDTEKSKENSAKPQKDTIISDVKVTLPIAEKTVDKIPNKSETVEKSVTVDTKSEQTPDVPTQDNETQYEKSKEKSDIVIMTKKNIVSMTTAAITSQPLDVVTTVTNQLPAALEKARDKAILERNSSKDSLSSKIDDDALKSKVKELKAIFSDDNIKMKPLQPPYNPQIERVKQKIDDILKAPEISPENILNSVTETKDPKKTFKNIADKTKSELRESKNQVADKLNDLKQQMITSKVSEEIRTEANKIIDSIMTPIEEIPKIEPKTNENKIENAIEPIVMVVNEKKSPSPSVSSVKINQTLIKEDDVQVNGSPPSIPVASKLMTPVKKFEEKSVDGVSVKSTTQNGELQSNGTPIPPARQNRSRSIQNEDESSKKEPGHNEVKKENICKRFLHKCAKRTQCSCCSAPEGEEVEQETKQGFMSKLTWCKKTEVVEDIAKSEFKPVEKATIEFEDETPKRTMKDLICCRGRKISDVPSESKSCFGGNGVENRRDSILSEGPAKVCCDNRLGNWFRKTFSRSKPEPSTSRRTSMFSKNKSLSPTLPPEDTRSKLDPSLIEHTSAIRAAIPALPMVLAYFCLVCNVIVPGLGTILSGMFCLCFGVPRFGVHDSAKHRIGSLIINILVGCLQLFTVMFCLVGWGWSIWWGVIMVRIARKFKKLKTESANEEANPPITATNHAPA